MYSFIVANSDLVLRKTEVAEKRINVQRESKMLLEYTRKAIAKLAELKKYASCPTFHILWKLLYMFLLTLFIIAKITLLFT